VALTLGVATGAGCGAVNGALVTRFRLPPFIVTLGTWNVFLALNLWFSRSQTIRAQDIEAVAPVLEWLGRPVELLGARLTSGALVMVALFGGAWYALNSVSPQAGLTANLDSVTAVVIGGTSLFGGRGSVVGTLIGALIVGTLRNGLALSGVEVLWQEFAVGLLIIVAVALDQWIRRL
jgi:fructose transport system permease protein